MIQNLILMDHNIVVTDLKHLHRKCIQYHRCYINNGYMEKSYIRLCCHKKEIYSNIQLETYFLRASFHLEFGQDINAYKYTVGAPCKPVTALSHWCKKLIALWRTYPGKINRNSIKRTRINVISEFRVKCSFNAFTYSLSCLCNVITCSDSVIHVSVTTKN